MTRMEAIRRQYEGAPDPILQGAGGAGPARPRHRFWPWLVAVVLAALVFGFLFYRKPVIESESAPASQSAPAPQSAPVSQSVPETRSEPDEVDRVFDSSKVDKEQVRIFLEELRKMSK